MIDDLSHLSLEQCASTPTRGSNLLGLVFTNRYEMVPSVEVTDNLPNADHDYSRHSSTKTSYYTSYTL